MPRALGETRRGEARLNQTRPSALRMAELEADCASIRQLLFGDFPSLEEIARYMNEPKETIDSCRTQSGCDYRDRKQDTRTMQSIESVRVGAEPFLS